MRKKLVVANWKMNPASAKEALYLAGKIEKAANTRNTEVIVAPPFPYLVQVGRILKKAKLGAQNTSWENSGPFTGEVSPRELRDLQVNYVIIGHSERRLKLGETEEMVNKKLKAALASGLQAILCVGEKERSEKESIPATAGEQLKSALKGIKRSSLKNLIVCYEPVWAISSQPGAKADTPDNVFRAMLYIRKTMAGIFGRAGAKQVRVIYGGSVNAANARSFVCEGKIEGVLVGSASLDPREFGKIIKTC